ncbi:hypothetical protein STXM2123_5983 [Streptomyces sp. F-3]|nr:hypothetical protein STXM2123_5983 [Streptomyces sp. F-3]
MEHRSNLEEILVRSTCLPISLPRCRNNPDLGSVGQGKAGGSDSREAVLLAYQLLFRGFRLLLHVHRPPMPMLTPHLPPRTHLAP